jgi:hypothetical protein
VPASGSSRCRKAQPTTLSMALCRPTSSRTHRARRRRRKPRRVQPPVAANAACASRSRSGSDATSAAGAAGRIHARRLDRHRLERALAADAARRRGVEAALQPLRIEAGASTSTGSRRGRRAARASRASPSESRSRARAPRRARASASSRRPDAADPDLERLLDRDPVALGRAGR